MLLQQVGFVNFQAGKETATLFVVSQYKIDTLLANKTNKKAITICPVL